MQQTGSSRGKDIAGGLLVAMIGLGAVGIGRGYPLGTLTRMGPGFFPVAVGTMMAAMGMLIAVAGLTVAPAPGQPTRPDWRGWGCIILGVAAFPLLGSRFGLVPATFVVVFVSALGERHNSLLSAAALAASMVVFCLLIFVLILRLPFPLFGPAG